MQRETRSLERRSKNKLSKLRRELNGLASKVSEELYSGRRNIQELQQERERLDTMVNKRKTKTKAGALLQAKTSEERTKDVDLDE